MLLSHFEIGVIPDGYCQCGCGQQTNIAYMTSTRKGIRKGQHYHFILGHRRIRLPLPDRFWLHVDKSSDPNSCWEWQSDKDRDGYGLFRIHRHGKSHSIHAHQVAYELSYGPIPEGKEVCHKCHNRACQNPAHLYAGTHQENIHDAMRAGHFGPPAPRYGEKHPQAKLTATDVSEIRTLYTLGSVTYRQLAERFGVSPSMVCRIVHRKNWQHIP